MLEFDSVDELKSLDDVSEALRAVEQAPSLGGGLHELDDHRQTRRAAAAALGPAMPQSHRRERALNRVDRSQMLPVLGGSRGRLTTPRGPSSSIRRPWGTSPRRSSGTSRTHRKHPAWSRPSGSGAARPWLPAEFAWEACRGRWPSYAPPNVIILLWNEVFYRAGREPSPPFSRFSTTGT